MAPVSMERGETRREEVCCRETRFVASTMETYSGHFRKRRTMDGTRTMVAAVLVLMGHVQGVVGQGMLGRTDGVGNGPHVWPRNATGTYRGNWEREEYNRSITTLPLLDLERGSAVLRIAVDPGERNSKDVVFVRGELQLRQTLYFADKDENLRLQGVYIAPHGRLIAFSESKILAEMSTEDMSKKGDEYRQALRLTAKRYANSGPTGRSRLAMNSMDSFNPLSLRKRCSFRVDLRFKTEEEKSERQPIEGSRTYKGRIVSDNCHFSLRVNGTQVLVEKYHSKAINYTLVVSIINFIQVALIIRQMERTNTQASAAKVSILTIALQAILDAYICLSHLTGGLVVDTLFNAFATVAFFKFVMFSIFEMRFMLTIWKARRPASFETWNSTRRELNILYSRFYLCMLAGILLLYEWQKFLPVLSIGFYSFWMPQIVENAMQDIRKPLMPQYILGMSITRLFIPCYFLGCPQNFLHLDQHLQVCFTLVGWVGLQTTMLLTQHYYGPRWFVPRRFLPEKYDFYRQVDLDMTVETGGSSDIDCVICMTPVDVKNRRSRMVTPCDHFFHPECLERWMEIKLECPYCRTPLPSL